MGQTATRSVVRTGHPLSELGEVLKSAPGACVARSGNGVTYLAFDAVDTLQTWMLATQAKPWSRVVEWSGADVRAAVELWPAAQEDFAVMERLKAPVRPAAPVESGETLWPPLNRTSLVSSRSCRTAIPDAPTSFDLDKCVHCGLCLNACPTYRELGVEMDSPRGRVYQMVQVATGQQEMGPSYLLHLDLCLACRACETVCPSGVPYGRMIEAARAEIQVAKQQAKIPQSRTERLVRSIVFGRILPSRRWLKTIGVLLYLYEQSGLRGLVQGCGVLKLFGKLGRIEPLSPSAELPTFFSKYGRVFAAEGERRYRVALLGGCIANIFFARLHEATVRVLTANGCEVHVPENQTCCGALHAHSGEREQARVLARKNIDALLPGDYDAIISNTAGCGSTLKEYHELLEHDAAYADRAREFVKKMRDVNEFLAGIGLTRTPGRIEARVTYQDSCHLLHGQKIRNAPRQLLAQIPGVTFVRTALQRNLLRQRGRL